MKSKTSISIDSFLLEKAQKRPDIIVSAIAEKALRQALLGSIEDEEEERLCRCGAKADIWLCPDEIWVCDKCNKAEIRGIKLGIIAKK